MGSGMVIEIIVCFQYEVTKMEKLEHKEMYVKKEDVIAELFKPQGVAKSLGDYLEKVYRGINGLPTYVATDTDSIDYTDLSGDLRKAFSFLERHGSNKQPSAIQFANVCGENYQHSDVRPFISYDNLVMQVCRKAIDVYGEEVFKKATLGDIDKKFASSAVNPGFARYFVRSKKFQPDKDWAVILDDCYVLKNLSAATALKLVGWLIAVFPEAKPELLCE